MTKYLLMFLAAVAASFCLTACQAPPKADALRRSRRDAAVLHLGQQLRRVALI